MIVRESKRWIRFLKTTAIGGLIFLLPLIVLSALIAQVASIIAGLEPTLEGFLPDLFKTPSGIALLIWLAIIVLVLLCFGAGLLARLSFGQRLTKLFEKNLLMLFPRYAIIKEQMADTIGGRENRPQMKAVAVRLDDRQMIGFETERSEDGSQVAVYLPGSPDTWAGRVAIFDADRVQSLPATFGETAATFEQVGRGSFGLMEKKGGKAVRQ